MTPFQFGFDYKKKDTVSINVNFDILDNCFSSLITGLVFQSITLPVEDFTQYHNFEKFGQHRNEIEDKLVNANSKVYIKIQLYEHIREFFRKHKIKEDIEPFCIIACYCFGWKKMSCLSKESLINFDSELSAKLKFFKDLENFTEENYKIISLKVYSKITKKKENLFNAPITHEYLFSIIQDGSIKLNNLRKFYFQKVKASGLNTENKFIIQFKRPFARELLKYLELHTKLIKPLNKNSSFEQRRIIGYYYHLLNLSNDKNSFFNTEEILRKHPIKYSDEMIRADLKY